MVERAARNARLMVVKSVADRVDDLKPLGEIAGKREGGLTISGPLSELTVPLASDGAR